MIKPMIAGRNVTGIGLGTAQFAFRDGTAEESVATVRAAVDAGAGLIDTALACTRAGEESYAEQIVARALRVVSGERPLVATKGGHWRDGARRLTRSQPAPPPNSGDGRPAPGARPAGQYPGPRQDSMKASRSALMVAASVVGMPCGNPGYDFSVPFCTSLADSGPASA